MASAELVGSGIVGPDAITEGSSPGTSEIISDTTVAGAAATAEDEHDNDRRQEPAEYG